MSKNLCSETTTFVSLRESIEELSKDLKNERDANERKRKYIKLLETIMRAYDLKIPSPDEDEDLPFRWYD